MREIGTLLRELKRYGSAGRDCALAAEDALAIVAALEAAREDACVALVADIRFACGDNGKRMQPELVEFIRGLAVDAERYRWLKAHDNAYLLAEEVIDDQIAIDQARGKGGAG